MAGQPNEAEATLEESETIAGGLTLFAEEVDPHSWGAHLVYGSASSATMQLLQQVV